MLFPLVARGMSTLGKFYGISGAFRVVLRGGARKLERGGNAAKPYVAWVFEAFRWVAPCADKIVAGPPDRNSIFNQINDLRGEYVMRREFPYVLPGIESIPPPGAYNATPRALLQSLVEPLPAVPGAIEDRA